MRLLSRIAFLALPILPAFGAGALPAFATGVDDPRTAYDVLAYRLDLRIDPYERRLEGTAAVEARVVAGALDELVLDLADELQVSRVAEVDAPLADPGTLAGPALAFHRDGERLACRLAAPAAAGDVVRVAVTYSGRPVEQDDFTGLHWRSTADGRPWIGTSFQLIGAHHWFPCKASYFHPEDKPDRVFVNADVPAGLYAVSNGRLVAREERDGGREVFRWRHDYPLETYSVTLDVAPYVVVETPLDVPGLQAPVTFAYYVLPEDAEKAALQFQDVPRMIAIYSEAFGPFPFPGSKIALVETSFWGMEHSTAVAYGSSFPAWCRKTGARDPFAQRNAFFDYILVHESAHEWWGNAVSAADWGDFWIHEGFATYAEGVYVERTQGRDAADRFFDYQESMVGRHARLWRGAHVENASKAYDAAIYNKGACVLDTLRDYVADDEAWWSALRAFFAAHRYGNAGTRDFQAELERATGRDWTRFFDEWVYGEGQPRLTGTVEAAGDRILVRVECKGSGATGFHVPLDLAWNEGGRRESARVWLAPGANDQTLERSGEVTGLELVGLQRVLGRHDVTVR
jgi:aminopeptidase N